MKSLLSLTVLVLLLGGAALLNPSAETHKEAIIARYKAQNPISGALGVGHALAEGTTYQNYVVFSTTTLGEEKISTGYVGHIDVRSLDLNELPAYLLDQLPEDTRRQRRQ